MTTPMRALAAIAMSTAMLAASAQEPLCNPCVDGPEMFQRGGVLVPLNGAAIEAEGAPVRGMGRESIAEVLGRAGEAWVRCGEPSATTLAGTEWRVVECDRGAGSRELRISPAGASVGSSVVLLLDESRIMPVPAAHLLDASTEAAYRELLAMSERGELEALLRTLRADN